MIALGADGGFGWWHVRIVGDFLPQQLAVVLPHPLHGGFQGGLCHAD